MSSFEFTKDNYAELSQLAIQHEKLIAKSKDEIKETILYIPTFRKNKK